MFIVEDMITMIKIKVKTRTRLKKLWQHGDDTYDSVINKLIDEAKTK